jgi:sugar/nucleoside kinase (ribokinase family)
MNSRNRTYDLLAVGELLVDLIGQDLADDLRQTRDFHRYQGGSPANMAANMARLGNRAALVACVGNDNLGVYLKDRVAESGVETHFIATHPTAPPALSSFPAPNAPPISSPTAKPIAGLNRNTYRMTS